MTFEVDDQVRLRKAHPCGGTDWVVFRLGADIGLRCGTCGHRVLVPRRELERRVVRLLRPQEAEASPGVAPAGGGGAPTSSGRPRGADPTAATS